MKRCWVILGVLAVVLSRADASPPETWPEVKVALTRPGVYYLHASMLTSS